MVTIKTSIYETKLWTGQRLADLSFTCSGRASHDEAGDVVIIALVVSFGTEAVAGNAIGEVLTQFNYMPAFGVATATVMQVARAVGEDDWARVDRLSKQTFCLSFILMLPLTLSIYALGTPLSYLLHQRSCGYQSQCFSDSFFTFRDSYDNGNGHLYSCLARFGKCPTSLLCDKYWNVVHPYWDWLPDGNCFRLGFAWYLGRNAFG